MSIKRMVTCCLVSGLITHAHATTISVRPSQPVIGVNGSDIVKRVCYYQDQAYSDGAIIQVGEHYMVCTQANNFETNGALKWVQLDTKPGSAHKPAQPLKRYSVN